MEQSDLLGFVEGDCSPDEAAAMQAWIAADPRRGALLEDLREVWRLTGRHTRSWVGAGVGRVSRTVRGREASSPHGSPRPVARSPRCDDSAPLTVGLWTSCNARG